MFHNTSIGRSQNNHHMPVQHRVLCCSTLSATVWSTASWLAPFGLSPQDCARRGALCIKATHNSVSSGDLSLNNSQSCSRAGKPAQKVVTTSSSGSSRCPASSRCSSLINSCFRRICRRWMCSHCNLHCIWLGLFNQSSVISALAAIVCRTL